jgi:hypothetical protein
MCTALGIIQLSPLSLAERLIDVNILGKGLLASNRGSSWWHRYTAYFASKLWLHGQQIIKLLKIKMDLA